MIQLSVYARICNGTDSVAVHKARLNAALPPRGSVRMLVITEKQYSSIEILLGSGTVYDAPQQMEQLMLFKKKLSEEDVSSKRSAHSLF